MIGTLRKTTKQQTKQHNAEQRRETRSVLYSETDSSACLGSCVPEGVADTTTDFIFSERIETIRDDSPKDTPPVPLERLLHQIGSPAAADDANMLFMPNKIAHHI